jgi:hypothetical protein
VRPVPDAVALGELAEPITGLDDVRARHEITPRDATP